ncbi:hypothetical protein PIB30_109492, partial [Stylosanthes scabra]|nr:hypothetical protein [Stylosanthes scabra]
AEDHRFVVGGYYMNEDRIISVWMGEEIVGDSEADVYLQGLEITVQFLLEDLLDRDGKTILISSRKNMVDWINGNQNTSCENRFMRNKFWTKRQVFNEVLVTFKQSNDFKAKDQWEDIAKHNKERWIRWNDVVTSEKNNWQRHR